MQRSIAILGSTGSVGKSTLDVVRQLEGSLRVKALTAHSNILLLEEQIREFQPEIVAVSDEKSAEDLKRRHLDVKIVVGVEGLCEVASLPSVDSVMVAIVGMAALRPTLAAIRACKQVLLANKEVLVAAGELVTGTAKSLGVKLIPVDSEHSGLFQCLEGEEKASIRRLILTASGGPFFKKTKDELKNVTLEEALCHPTWTMGKKITVDSSTWMNKGFEVIEAAFLFDMPPEKIDVVIHPQSIIHSFVEFIDGTLLAQFHEPKMHFPIQYALTYPQRERSVQPPFDFMKRGHVEFYPPDLHRFPALSLAYEAVKQGKSLPCYLNGANEILVERFLKKEILWFEIADKLEKLLEKHRPIPCDTLDAIFFVDKSAKEEAKQI